MTKTYDHRVTPARPDLAAEYLRGKIDAQNYVAGKNAEVSVGVSPIFRSPDENAPRETELLFGEEVVIYDEQKDWAWVQSKTDQYVGYTQAGNLDSQPTKRTHFVKSLRTYIFSEPDIKSRPTELLSMNSQICSEGREGQFIKCTHGGFVFEQHTHTSHDELSNFVQTAELFIGTPYLWGGRTSLGLDCSALVQNSLAQCGLSVPRDTDMQETSIGKKIAAGLEETSLQRGDLIFWKGHVAIMQDHENIVHANGTWMCVSTDNVHEFSERVVNDTGPVISVKRL